MYSRFGKNCCAFYVLMFMSVSLLSAKAASNPPSLAEGQWYKIGIPRQGIYKLSYQYLQTSGFINAETNPQHIRLYGQGGGMLPQANAEQRPNGLQENAIFISGEEDGRFDPQDYILFYGQGPDKVAFHPDRLEFDYEKNLYSDTVFYFLTLSTEKGKRIGTLPDLNISTPLITTYNGFGAYEVDIVNLLNTREPKQGSGRRWFGENLPPNVPSTYSLPLFNIEPNQPVTVRAAFASTSTRAGSIQLSANNVPVATHEIPAISDPKTYPYAEKGVILEKTTQVNSNRLANLNSFSIKLQQDGSQNGAIYLDYLSASALCRLQYREEALFFRSAQSMQYPEVRYQLSEAPSDLQVWDISQPRNALLQNAVVQDNKLSFGTSAQTLKEFVAFRLADVQEPLKIQKIANQNLRTDISAEMLIVSHPSLLAEAQRLADFRTQHDGLKVKVVTTEQIYNEFSSGAQDVTAIRDYTRYLYQTSGSLRYLLLFGRGYFDYKKRTEHNYNLVPVYESYNSVNPIYSYASDDYFGFLEEEEGSWEENEYGNHSLDIGIGRLPVKNMQEARQVVDKLIRYSTAPEALGSWRNNLVFVADDEDGNVHNTDADRLAGMAETFWPDSRINKLYLGAFPQEPNASGQRSPKMIDALDKAIEKGALIVNYTGHGNWERLTDEFVITKPVVNRWENQYRLPLFVTATCDYGRHDSNLISGAEELLLKPDGGAIGLLTTARPVYSHTNFEINSAFYENVFPEEGAAPRRLGDVVRLSKNKGSARAAYINRNFILLGDPSMKLAFPGEKAVIDKLIPQGTAIGTDTLNAYTKVKANGFVLNVNQKSDHSFNGEVEAVVFEKPVTYSTLALPSTKENVAPTPPKEFSLRNNVIFRGTASVRDGAFSFSFIVPKSIMYKVGQGKINLYAIDEKTKKDASGYYDEFKIGGSQPNAYQDQTPPEVSLYLNDSSFVNGSKVGQKSILLAYFKDESGINLTNTGVEGSIIATLDGMSDFELSEYYFAAIDDYKAGSLQFPLEGLLPGKHTLSLTVRDNYNNISKSEIYFEVGEKNDFEIYKLLNFPNPFREKTRFSAEHSRAGEDMEAKLLIYNINGKLLFQKTQQFYQSQARLELDEWNLVEEKGEKLLPGVYLFKVILRSLTDGSVAERTEKLVILN